MGQSFWSNDVSLAQVGRFYVNIPILVCILSDEKSWHCTTLGQNEKFCPGFVSESPFRFLHTSKNFPQIFLDDWLQSEPAAADGMMLGVVTT